MTRKIDSVAVLGGGTMGCGIAGACAEAGCSVLLLDVSYEAAQKALDRIVNGRPPAIDTPEAAERIELGSFDDLSKIAGYDWICEAVIEDLDTKRALFERLEPLRKEGSVVSTNTSGIPLRSITEGMPERLRRDVAVTHFFNPVKVMKLMELVPDADTTRDAVDALAEFCGQRLGKGVVHAKDTVNFIGNRIGCYWMLAGLHKARAALEQGLSMEQVDALMGAPVGLPSTGLYGLIDLIGLDIMDFVAKNLDRNLPADDAGRAWLEFPSAEREMMARGQLGRKAGGGFYRPAWAARWPTPPTWCRRSPTTSSMWTAPCAGASPGIRARSSCWTTSARPRSSPGWSRRPTRSPACWPSCATPAPKASTATAARNSWEPTENTTRSRRNSGARHSLPGPGLAPYNCPER
jgi:3-hydroxyacyl-CoA dehydrogenase